MNKSQTSRRVHVRIWEEIYQVVIRGSEKQNFSPQSAVISPASRALSRGKLSSRSSIIEQPRHLIINGCVPLRALMKLPSHCIFPMASLLCQSNPKPAHPGRNGRTEIEKKKEENSTPLIQMAENVAKWQRGEPVLLLLDVTLTLRPVLLSLKMHIFSSSRRCCPNLFHSNQIYYVKLKTLTFLQCQIKMAKSVIKIRIYY